MVKTMVSCRFSLKPIQWLWDFSHFSASKRAAGDHPSSPRCRGHRQLDIVQAPFGCPADCGPLGRCTLENHDIVLIIRWSADPYVLGIKLQKRFFVKMTSHWFCIMKIHVMSRRQAAAPWPQAARVPTRTVGFHHHHKALAPGSWRQLDLPSGIHTKNKAMGNHHFWWLNQLFILYMAIATWKYQWVLQETVREALALCSSHAFASKVSSSPWRTKSPISPLWWVWWIRTCYK
jgi:hypothetical protein